MKTTVVRPDHRIESLPGRWRKGLSLEDYLSDYSWVVGRRCRYDCQLPRGYSSVDPDNANIGRLFVCGQVLFPLFGVSDDGVPKLVRRPPDPSGEVFPTLTAWADSAISLLRMPEDLRTDVSA